MATIELVNNPTDGSSSPGGHFFGSELDNLMQAINGCGVLGHTFSGTVTGADMIVTIPAITCWVPDGSGGKVYVSYAGGDVTITAAHATLPRTDIIVIDSAGTCTATAGTATAEAGDVEEAPTAALVNDEIMIAKVRVAAAVTVIGTDRVVGRAIDVSENHLGFTTKGADITSASALALPDAGQYFDVTGTVTVTSIESRPAGFVLVLQFDDALILTHNATTLILSGGANYTTAAGDIFTFVSEGSGNWREINRSTSPFAIPEMVEPFLSSYDAAPVITTFGTNVGAWIPIRPVSKPLSITALLANIGVQSANIDYGIYSFDGTTMTPVIRKGATSCPVAATKVSLALTATTLSPGTRYFFAFSTDNNTMTISQTSNQTVTPRVNYGFTKATSYPLPTAFAVSGATAAAAGLPYLIGNCGGTVS